MSKAIEKWRSMPLGARFGLALVLLGIFLPAAAYVYYATRNPVPVNEQVSLVPGVIHNEFRVDFPARYVLSLEFEPNIPKKTIHCMLGTHYQETQTNCSDTPRMVEFNWALRRSGEIVQTGNSIIHDNSDQHETVEASYAGFDLTRGSYEIELNILKDASALAVTHPKLLIEAGTYGEGKTLSLFFLVPVGIALALTGWLVMIWSYRLIG